MVVKAGATVVDPVVLVMGAEGRLSERVPVVVVTVVGAVGGAIVIGGLSIVVASMGSSSLEVLAALTIVRNWLNSVGLTLSLALSLLHATSKAVSRSPVVLVCSSDVILSIASW